MNSVSCFFPDALRRVNNCHQDSHNRTVVSTPVKTYNACHQLFYTESKQRQINRFHSFNKYNSAAFHTAA